MLLLLPSLSSPIRPAVVWYFVMLPPTKSIFIIALQYHYAQYCLLALRTHNIGILTASSEQERQNRACHHHAYILCSAIRVFPLSMHNFLG